ncbi:MAG: tetratricopeptide repeat protein [Acidobacteria bacterium]|nr:tetratricopeptide repeat protein [Acidobacteriota bacterium]
MEGRNEVTVCDEIQQAAPVEDQQERAADQDAEKSQAEAGRADATEASTVADTPVVEELPMATARVRWSALLIVGLGVLAYLNSFEGAFVFDDLLMLGNPNIKSLWPLWPTMFSPQIVTRPLIGLSYAINYAISGTHTWSYHALNLLIHICAALTLFGIVRRTLLSDRLRERFGKASTTLALVIAVLWMVHPLQTQAVTYVVQRCESLMGLCYLLTLYGVIRGFYSSRKGWWYGVAVVACAAGALSKQVIVTAPFVVLLYDYLFLSGSFLEALRKRWGLYAGLLATWGIIIATLLAVPLAQTAGFAVKTFTPFEYLRTQPAIIVYYLRLAVWPNPLCLDYDWKKAETVGEILPYTLIILGLLGGSVWALWRRKAVGFLGAWFFLILSLTSSFMPIDDLMFEHRMYLSLAAVVVLVVLAGYEYGKRLVARFYAVVEERQRVERFAALLLVSLLVTCFSLLTLRRNVDYRSDLVMWKDVLQKRPTNVRALNNVGTALITQDRAAEALPYFFAALKYKSDLADTENNLGRALIKLGRLEEGKTHLQEALRINPKHMYANFNLGQCLSFQGYLDEAIEHFRRVLEIDSKTPGPYAEIGMALEKQGKLDEAIEQYTQALKLDPQEINALGHLALVLATHPNAAVRNPEKAVRLAERSVQLTDGKQPFFLYALAVSYAEMGRFPEAITAGEQAKQQASELGNQEFAEAIEAQLKLYRAGRARSSKPS